MSKRSRACVFTQFHSMFGCSASVCDRFASVNLLAVVEPEPTEMTTTTTNVLHSTHFTENSVLRIFGSLHRTNRSHLSCVTLGPYHLTYNTPLLWYSELYRLICKTMSHMNKLNNCFSNRFHVNIGIVRRKIGVTVATCRVSNFYQHFWRCKFSSSKITQFIQLDPKSRVQIEIAVFYFHQQKK